MYKILLFDLDDTIFDFKAAEVEAITKVLQFYGFPGTPELIDRYSTINLKLWEQLERKEILIDDVLHSRFELFFKTLGMAVNGPQTEAIFRQTINGHASLIFGAAKLLSRVKPQYGIYAISNGLYKTQLARLQKAGITDLFDGLFISETVGINKPDPRFFQYVAQNIPGFNRDLALVIGDSLSSDIQGGINAGIDTCWFNRQFANRPEAASPLPTYEIHRLEELDLILANIPPVNY